MSERDDYPHGVPCWVTCLVDDVPAAVDFYGELFGWASDLHEEAGYATAHLRGREVAGIGSLSEAGPGAAAAWITNVRVDDAAAAAREARVAGGAVLADDLDMAPAGRLSVIADPGGAVFGAWEAAERRGAQVINEPGAWSMSLLQAPDPDGALAFYRQLFRWETEPFGPATMLRLPGYVGGEPEQPVPRDVVAACAPSGGEAARWAVDFWVADAEAAATTAQARGGKVLEAVHDAPPFRQARLADPEGAEFSVSQLAV